MKLSTDTLEEFYEQLSDLLKAGVNVAEAIERLSGRVKEIKSSTSQKASKLLHDGKTTEAFSMIDLPDRDVQLLDVGQRSGELQATCDQLAGIYREWNDVKSSALVSMIWIFLAGVMFILIPSILVFMGMGVSAASSAGEASSGLLWGLIGGLMVFVPLIFLWSGFLWITVNTVKRLFYGQSPPSGCQFLLHLPIVSSLYEHITYALFYFQWRALYEAGVSPDKVMVSLDQFHPESETVLPYVSNRLEEGSNYRELSLMSDFLPRHDYGEICTGEEAGTLDDVLKQLEQKHFQNFIELLENLPSYMRWVLLAVYGLTMIVGFLVLMYLIVVGGYGMLSSSALPDGALP